MTDVGVTSNQLLLERQVLSWLVSGRVPVSARAGCWARGEEASPSLVSPAAGDEREKWGQ